jgi:hypothetical protein
LTCVWPRSHLPGPVCSGSGPRRNITCQLPPPPPGAHFSFRPIGRIKPVTSTPHPPPVPSGSLFRPGGMSSSPPPPWDRPAHKPASRGERGGLLKLSGAIGCFPLAVTRHQAAGTSAARANRPCAISCGARLRLSIWWHGRLRGAMRCITFGGVG